jgi:hypothetical protein
MVDFANKTLFPFKKELRQYKYALNITPMRCSLYGVNKLKIKLN